MRCNLSHGFKKLTLLLSFLGLFIFASADADDQCTGTFINPITDVSWKSLFPITIGDMTVVKGDNPDTDNPSSPIQICPAGVLFRIGLAIGFWEPAETIEETRDPFCFPLLDGFQMSMTGLHGHGADESAITQDTGSSFYQSHEYIYPLLSWIRIITSVACMQGGNYDIGYISELDPTWNDDQLTSLLNPEAFLFGNPIAQAACAFDAIKALHGSAEDKLFWCLGSQGSAYPMDGNIDYAYSPLENSVLIAERLEFKLHRLGLAEDSNSTNGAVCHTSYKAILPKDRYRYEMEFPTADSNHSYPFGHTSSVWGSSKLKPNDKGNYGYLIWRKRNCVFL
jgi:conjugal transfer pilus assembly protein TraU